MRLGPASAESVLDLAPKKLPGEVGLVYDRGSKG